MRSSNPVLRENTFQGLFAEGERMTLNGTLAKTGLLLLLAVVTGGWTWHRFATLAAGGEVNAAMAAIAPFLWGGLIAGFVLAMASTFLRQWSGITAPLYAIAEGFALGGISAFMELRYPGIVLQAVLLTAGVLAAMLVLYRTRVIKVTDKFRTGVVAATGAIVLLYLVDLGLRAFTSIQVPFIHESGALGIGFSLLVVGLAGAQPDAGLRPDRTRHAGRCAEIHGVVRRVRADGDAGVAVHGDPAAALQIATLGFRAG